MSIKSKSIWLLILLLLMPLTASAAPAENDTPGQRNSLIQLEQDKLPNGEQGHYYIDLGEEVEEEEESGGFMDSIQNFNPIGNGLKDAAAETMISFKTTIIDLAWEWNKTATGFLIWVMQFAFDTQIINFFIDGVASVVSEISGISGGVITGGLFGNLLVFSILAAAILGVYRMVVLRQPLATFQGILQTTFALIVAMVIIGSFGTLMKSLNNVSSDMSASMFAGGASVVVGETRTQEQLKEAVGNSIWQEFVTRPYLILQYGYDDIDDIGEARINELLLLPKGDERETYVLETEIQERGNVNMTPEQLDKRMIFTVVYLIINGVVSIPIILIAILLLGLQAWFLFVAVYAPFALIQSTAPGQLPVLKRYIIELLLPLVLKVLLTVGAIVVFSLGFMVYSIPMPQSLGISKYFVNAVLQLVLFLGLFLIRNRIMKIVGAGNRGPFEAVRGDISRLRHSMDNVANKMGGVAKVAGAAAIGVATGGSGTVGKMVGGAVVNAMNKDGVQEEDTPTVRMNEQEAPQTVSLTKEDADNAENHSNSPENTSGTTTVRAQEAKPEKPLKQAATEEYQSVASKVQEKEEKLATIREQEQAQPMVATGTDNAPDMKPNTEQEQETPIVVQYETDAAVVDNHYNGSEIEAAQPSAPEETQIMEQDMSLPLATLGEYDFEIETAKEREKEDLGDIEERGHQEWEDERESY